MATYESVRQKIKELYWGENVEYDKEYNGILIDIVIKNKKGKNAYIIIGGREQGKINEESVKKEKKSSLNKLMDLKWYHIKKEGVKSIFGKKMNGYFLYDDRKGYVEISKKSWCTGIKVNYNIENLKNNLNDYFRKKY